MIDIQQELMTPIEAARWFRRSPSWLRQQTEVLRVAGPGGQPLYHVRVCRAYILAKMTTGDAEQLRRIQIRALAEACGLTSPEAEALVASAVPVQKAAPVPAI